MLPASNKGAGMNIGFPDVCLTPAPPAPPIPVPYPNMALNAQAVPFAITVKVSGVNALNMGSMVPLTTGDEGGVAHATIKGPGRYTIGNMVVHVEALPGANALLPTTGNNMNDGLGAAVVPSVVNVFFTLDGAAPRPDVDVRAIRDLARAIAPAHPDAERIAEGVLYLAIPAFSTDVPARVFTALQREGIARVAALILDLRGCPGGALVAALELAGDFLEPGAVVVTAIDGDGDETVHRARGGSPHRFPLALLVDRGTASAAEIFAGALRAHGRALVVGERTHGKGSAQRIGPGLTEPGARYATALAFTLPDGAPLEGRGVQPDVDVPPGEALAVALTALLSPKEVR
jgi:carboxyl-terminal processing protease